MGGYLTKGKGIDIHGVSLISVLSSVDKRTRGKQNGGCDLVVLRVCICVGCDVAGGISMAFTVCGKNRSEGFLVL